MAEIGKRIRLRREELGMTQEELAYRLGYKSKTTIAKIENGTNDIVQSKVLAFANALNTTSAYLMGWTAEKSSPIATVHDQLNKQEKRINTFVQLFHLHGYTVETSENTVKISKDSNYCILTQKEFATLLNRCYKDFEYNISRYMDEYDSKMAVAAHERTDIEVTDEMKQHDDDIMDDDDF